MLLDDALVLLDDALVLLDDALVLLDDALVLLDEVDPPDPPSGLDAAPPSPSPPVEMLGSQAETTIARPIAAKRRRGLMQNDIWQACCAPCMAHILARFAEGTLPRRSSNAPKRFFCARTSLVNRRRLTVRMAYVFTRQRYVIVARATRSCGEVLMSSLRTKLERRAYGYRRAAEAAIEQRGWDHEDVQDESRFGHAISR
ncbi:hypothetical protein [Polyangium sp. 6x1]|uniref:hypothetical protein n=1 Tax=Polyangium sp. 6x1 TaxID=3042689 RepID=UPI002482971D|nr:hypothetical protein [Polyangium sp. 6x1]MDI1442599.1 hypothetical protein [Polyangium sp. 6x1]